MTFNQDYGELIFKRSEAPPVGMLFLRQRPRRAPVFAQWIRATLESKEQRARLRGHMAVQSPLKTKAPNHRALDVCALQ